MDHLLPNTELRFAYRDSKCDSTRTLVAAQQLLQGTTDGMRVSAIIGAGCSGSSVTAAQVGEGSLVPIISPSATSAVLDSGKAYPYLLRTVPSDTFATIAMVDGERWQHLNRYWECEPTAELLQVADDFRSVSSQCCNTCCDTR
eukprot:1678790-Prymnesium_polylepis.1